MTTKQERKIFTITEYDREQEYLSKRHKEGWKFTAVTGYGMYHFEKCEPEDVVYQLDYNIEGNINHEEYTRMLKTVAGSISPLMWAMLTFANRWPT